MATDHSEELLTGVELKALGNAFDWDEVPTLSVGENLARRATTVLRILRELSENFRKNMRGMERILARLARCSKTPVAAYYVKLLAMRPLRRMQVLLRQQLATSAPVGRLILRNRLRHLFVARPPIAPPHFA